MNAFSSGYSGRNRTNACLRTVEESLTRLETHTGYVATKEDIETLKKDMGSLKVWMLSRGLAAIVTTVGLTLALMKLLFFSDGSG